MAQDTVQEIKNRLTIQDVVAPHVKLHRAGRSLTGLCPFHKEKTPSFHVSLERGTYHCFGCGEGGDMFSFIEKVEGVDFKGALKLLAEKAGVEVVFDPKSKEKAGRTERLREAVNRAQAWYAAQLKIGHSMSDLEGGAFAYAKKRGLSEETIKSWGLGYAPLGWRGLLEALSALGFSTEELLSAGLIKEADGKKGTYYDRFRNRLLFPIRDISGRPVGFTGRALADDEPAKYLNSPEGDLYHKSELLYGMDRAKDAIRTRGFTMLVEGQMDVLLAHQAGFENAVALSGTALTERHLALMKRFSDNLLLVLDADSAGLSATAKSATLALHAGMHVKAARLPSGKDPADLITEDPKLFSARVKEAKPVVDFFLAVCSEREHDPHRLIALAERAVLPLIAAVQSPMEREHFMRVAGQTLGLSVEAVRESLGRVQSARTDESPRAITAPPTARETQTSAREVREKQLLATVHAYRGSALAKRVEAEYSRITGVHPLPQEALLEPMAFHMERTFGAEPSEDAADELLRAFELAVLREAYQEAVHTLRRAEAAGDAASVQSAQSVCADLSLRLSALGF